MIGRGAGHIPTFLFVVISGIGGTGCGSSSSSSAAGGADAGHDASGDAGSAPGDAGTSPADGGSAQGSDAGADAAAPHDGGPAKEAGADAGFVPGQAITAPAETWTWIPFSNAFCGNGTTTGIGVNLTTKSSRVLIYLEGGGACWDAETCYTAMSAAYFTTGYGQADFAAESADATYLALPGGFFDRTAAANPFADYSYVYVPYCTGDVHSGNNVTTLGTNVAHFVGHANMTAFLERIVPTFPGADRVILAGSSAGGYGAMHNWWQTQNAFGAVRVDAIDDSGTYMPPDVLAMGDGAQVTEATAWGLAATAPPCSACATDPAAIYGFYAQAYPTHRGALLSYTMDSVLPTFFGITEPEFTMGLDEDVAAEFTPNPNLQSFLFGGAGHVLFFSPLLTQSGVTVQSFVTQMVTDSTAWASVHP